jgi:hypothetical protein
MSDLASESRELWEHRVLMTLPWIVKGDLARKRAIDST